MKHPSPYRIPKACVACGHTEKFQKLYMTSFMTRVGSNNIETIEVPGEICDRCYSRTKTEIDTPKPVKIPQREKHFPKSALCFILVLIPSIIAGFLFVSFWAFLIVLGVGLFGVWVIFLDLNPIVLYYNPVEQKILNDRENPIRKHLNILRIKKPVSFQGRKEVLVFVFRSSTFMYMFNRSNQDLLSKREIYSILHNRPYDIDNDEIMKLIRRQEKPGKYQERSKKQTTTTSQDFEGPKEKDETKCPFCGAPGYYPQPSCGIYDLVSCKSCGERFIPQ
ncbi:MAG: hypothetical protein ACFFE2_02425 [Candidatus Thorarchaeota archaeon]